MAPIVDFGAYDFSVELAPPFLLIAATMIGIFVLIVMLIQCCGSNKKEIVSQPPVTGEPEVEANAAFEEPDIEFVDQPTEAGDEMESIRLQTVRGREKYQKNAVCVRESGEEVPSYKLMSIRRPVLQDRTFVRPKTPPPQRAKVTQSLKEKSLSFRTAKNLNIKQEPRSSKQERRPRQKSEKESASSSRRKSEKETISRMSQSVSLAQQDSSLHIASTIAKEKSVQVNLRKVPVFNSAVVSNVRKSR